MMPEHVRGKGIQSMDSGAESMLERIQAYPKLVYDSSLGGAANAAERQTSLPTQTAEPAPVLAPAHETDAVSAQIQLQPMPAQVQPSTGSRNEPAAAKRVTVVAAEVSATLPISLAPNGSERPAEAKVTAVTGKVVNPVAVPRPRPRMKKLKSSSHVTQMPESVDQNAGTKHLTAETSGNQSRKRARSDDFDPVCGER